jgi:hypothetical protein
MVIANALFIFSIPSLNGWYKATADGYSEVIDKLFRLAQGRIVV